MRNLSRIKVRFIVILAVLGTADLLLAGYLLRPGSSPSALEAQRKSLQEQNSAYKAQTGPLQNIDEKLGQTRTNIKALYQKNIPRRSSEVFLELDRLMRETGVTTQSTHYLNGKPEKGDLPEIQRVGIDTTVVGDYAKVAHFINALEQSDLLFIIDQISLTSQNKEGGTVSLSIKFETFLRERETT